MYGTVHRFLLLFPCNPQEYKTEVQEREICHVLELKYEPEYENMLSSGPGKFMTRGTGLRSRERRHFLSFPTSLLRMRRNSREGRGEDPFRKC